MWFSIVAQLTQIASYGGRDSRLKKWKFMDDASNWTIYVEIKVKLTQIILTFAY